MQGCGLTFARMVEAIEYQPADEREKLRRALQAELKNTKRLEREVAVLRGAKGASVTPGMPFRVAALLLKAMISLMAWLAVAWLVVAVENSTLYSLNLFALHLMVGSLLARNCTCCRRTPHGRRRVGATGLIKTDASMAGDGGEMLILGRAKLP
jgi:hypothetical protein